MDETLKLGNLKRHKRTIYKDVVRDESRIPHGGRGRQLASSRAFTTPSLKRV